MNLARENVGERLGFKAVCLDCGSLSIKATDLGNAPGETPIQCGRCKAVRGTLADLRILARRGGDLFEF
jgi:hypothetical protein